MDNAAQKKRRAVIVGGARTPFVKAFTDFVELSTIDLGVAAVRGLLERAGLPYKDVEAIVWGGVILPSARRTSRARSRSTCGSTPRAKG